MGHRNSGGAAGPYFSTPRRRGDSACRCACALEVLLAAIGGRVQVARQTPVASAHTVGRRAIVLESSAQPGAVCRRVAESRGEFRTAGEGRIYPCAAQEVPILLAVSGFSRSPQQRFALGFIIIQEQAP